LRLDCGWLSRTQARIAPATTCSNYRPTHVAKQNRTLKQRATRTHFPRASALLQAVIRTLSQISASLVPNVVSADLSAILLPLLPLTACLCSFMPPRGPPCLSVGITDFYILGYLDESISTNHRRHHLQANHRAAARSRGKREEICRHRIPATASHSLTASRAGSDHIGTNSTRQTQHRLVRNTTKTGGGTDITPAATIRPRPGSTIENIADHHRHRRLR
jgi:hypothetical protein